MLRQFVRVSTGTRARVLVLTAAVTGSLGLWAASGADAHVTVHADGAAPGGYTVLAFQVPTESDTASTTALAVQLPTDTPIASVSVEPHAGWSFTVKKETLTKPITTDDGPVSTAVGEIDWKADSSAAAIKPGEFDRFYVSAGPLPDVETLTFRALQTYSDGNVVKWIETAAPGSTAEPEHPAPALTLTPSNTPTAVAAPAVSHSDNSTTALTLGALGTALGLAAVVLVVVRRRPRHSS